MVEVEINVQQDAVAVDRRQLALAVQEVLTQEGARDAEISLAVVDNQTIHRLNRHYLRHDYPTDVLSFVLDHAPDGRLDGEIIVSLEMAAQQSAKLGWPVENELLLYVIHGALHLVGYDDQQAARRTEMRSKEQHYMTRLARAPFTPADFDKMQDACGHQGGSDQP